MKVLGNVVLVAGFCLGTLGASGFDQDTSRAEPNTWLYLGLGLAGILGGAYLLRAGTEPRSDGADGQGHPDAGLGWFRRSIEGIRGQVVALDEGRRSLGPTEIHRRIDELLGGDFFDLTTRHEELVKLVGFGAYAQVWESVAATERLLARSWSMITDGYHEEGLEELPLARESIEAAAREIAALG